MRGAKGLHSEGRWIVNIVTSGLAGMWDGRLQREGLEIIYHNNIYQIKQQRLEFPFVFSDHAEVL